MEKRKRTELMIACVKDAGRCELCGSKQNLEAHHIIPIAFGGPDVKENLICVCRVCHARLTPNQILTKKGIDTLKNYGKLFLDFYQMVHDRGSVSGVDVMDTFDVWFHKHFGQRMALPNLKAQELLNTLDDEYMTYLLYGEEAILG